MICEPEPKKRLVAEPAAGDVLRIGSEGVESASASDGRGARPWPSWAISQVEGKRLLGHLRADGSDGANP